MCPAGVFAVCGVVAYAAVEDADQSVAQCAQGLMVHVSGSVVVMCSGAAAATWVNMARETSKWLFECDPQVSPRASHTWAKRTEPFIVQKCGSARGMSTAHDRMVCQSSRQSVAIIFVAVGSPVALLEFRDHLDTWSCPTHRVNQGATDATSRWLMPGEK